MKNKNECTVCAVMQKDENYARGWVMLYSWVHTVEAAQMADYAIALQKLRLEHEGTHIKKVENEEQA